MNNNFLSKLKIVLLFVLFSTVFFSCTKPKSDVEIGNDFQFIGVEKIERHKLYSAESKGETFAFGDDWFECVIKKEKGKNNLKSFYYCNNSFSKKFEIEIELDICAEELVVGKISESLYGFAFCSAEGNNFFIYRKREKTAEKLFFDFSNENARVVPKIVDFGQGIIIGEVAKGNQKELYIFSTPRKDFCKVSEPQENDFAVEIAGERKLRYTDKNGNVAEFDFSKWILPLCEEIVRSQGATILKTQVLKDGAKVMRYPKNNAENICDLDFGKTIYVLGNYSEGDGEIWICCTESSNVEKSPLGYDCVFWLSPDDIELPNGYAQSEISFSKITQEFDPSKSSRYNSCYYEIEIAIKRGSDVSYQKVTTSKLDGQNICFFNWNDYEEGFSYYDSAGTYAWDTVTNEIYPVSWMGNLEGCFENLVTSDNKYLFAIKDFARADFFDTVEIMDNSNGESMGRWDFYKSLDYDGKSIVVGDEYLPSEKTVRGNAGKNSLKYAKDFESAYVKNSEEKSWGNTATIYVKYRLNLKDFSTEFIGCEYVKGYAFEY